MQPPQSQQQLYTNSKTLGHSSSMLAGDSYLAGMASDSELTSNSRHGHHAHHHHHHHRPFSSQSRVYHAHPVPRSSHGSSRMSHYSDSAASYTGSVSSATPSPGGQLSSPQRSGSGLSMSANKPPMGLQANQTPPGPHQHQTRGLSHQGSVSSVGNGGSVPSPGAYGHLGESLQHQLMGSGSQVQAAQLTGRAGRQLPQRPFKQSMSIDHHQGMGGQYQGGSPAHQLAYEAAPGVQVAMGSGELPAGYPSYQLAHQAHYGTPPSRSAASYRLEMELMEKQTANLKLFNSDSHHSIAHQQQQHQHQQHHLPPQHQHQLHLSEGQAAHASGSGRQLPPLGSALLAGEQTQYPQSGQQQQQPHQAAEAYEAQQLIGSSPGDWLASSQTANQQQKQPLIMGRPTGGSLFKQTMSIDHYPSGAPFQQHPQQQQLHHLHHQQQQQQQHHYSPVRAAQPPAGHFADHYRNTLNYTSSSPVCGYESPTGAAQSGAKLPHQYQSASNSGSASSDYYQAASHSSYAGERESAYQQPFRNLQDLGQQPHQHSQDSASYSQAHSRSSSSGHPPAQIHQQQQQLAGQVQRSSLQHQVSSSSSNSQSGSLRSSNVDVHKASVSAAHQQPEAANEGAGQSRLANAGLPPAAQFQSPQHKASAASYSTSTGRHAALRKGYTSVASGYRDSSIGSMALSESGDLSSSQGHSAGAHLSSYAASKRSAMRATSPSMGVETSSLSGQQHGQHAGLPREPIGSVGGGTRSESSTGLPGAIGMGNNSSLTKKSNSATQLSMTGTKKRLGFRKKQVTSFSVHRSEEVAPFEARHLVKQGSSVSEGDSSMSGDSSSRSWSNSNFKQPTSDELASMSFIDGLGKGQMISRQGLASPYLGDIQLSLCDRRGNLEVEVIRARNLQAKTNKILPLTYVKLYLVKNRKCLAKAKTPLSNKRTLDPLFQQQLTFHEDYHGCILQSIIWGNFGKMDKKNFMGIAQISIDDLELSDTVISWYKLFLPSSLQTLPSKSLRHTLLSNSTESFTNTNNSAANSNNNNNSSNS